MGRSLSDKELVALLKRGRHSALEEVCKRYSARIYSLAYRLTRCHSDCEEILQDVFVTIYRKIKGFEGKSSLGSWIYRVTANTALMKLRKRRQNKAALIEDVCPHYHNSIEFIDRRSAVAPELAALGKQLEEAIGELPMEYRLAFVLRDVDGLSTQEVATLLKISGAALKSRLHRARLILRKKLSHLQENQEISEAA